MKTAGRDPRKPYRRLARVPLGPVPTCGCRRPLGQTPPSILRPAVRGRTRHVWGPLPEGRPLAPLSGVPNRLAFRQSTLLGMPSQRTLYLEITLMFCVAMTSGKLGETAR